MPVSRKPSSTRRKTQDVEEFIQGGGSEPQEKAKPKAVAKPTVQPIKLRVPGDLLEEMDAAVNQRRPSPSRHQWILEAIYEKLEREQGEG